MQKSPSFPPAGLVLKNKTITHSVSSQVVALSPCPLPTHHPRFKQKPSLPFEVESFVSGPKEGLKSQPVASWVQVKRKSTQFIATIRSSSRTQRWSEGKGRKKRRKAEGAGRGSLVKTLRCRNHPRRRSSCPPPRPSRHLRSSRRKRDPSLHPARASWS